MNDIPMQTIQEHSYELMFINCTPVKFVNTTVVIERPEQEKISEPKKFDDFDWNKDFSEAYKE